MSTNSRGRPKALDIGAGDRPVRTSGWFENHDRFEKDYDWVTLDSYHPMADVNADLNEGKLPFADNEFDAAFARHVLEHIEKKALLPVLKEVNRVVKEGGHFYVIVPWWSGHNYAADPTHITPFNDSTFKGVCGAVAEHSHYMPTLFACQELRFVMNHKWRWVPRPLLREMYHVMTGVCEELWVTLRVTKDGKGGFEPKRTFIVARPGAAPGWV